jgi:hypothetical protein
MTMHILIAALPEYRWEAIAQEHPTGEWAPLAKGNRLQPIVEQALDVAGQSADLTFSSWPTAVVLAEMIETPEQLATGARGCSIEILMPEGRIEGPDDRWASVYRDHDSRRVFSSGLSSVFRPQTLRTEILNWFERKKWSSFGAPRPNRNEPSAPWYGRMLLVRHGNEWRARQICPADFPVFRPGPVHHTTQAPRP